MYVMVKYYSTATSHAQEEQKENFLKLNEVPYVSIFDILSNGPDAVKQEHPVQFFLQYT